MKHKRLMAILLALAMMITFMPTMAFADEGTSADDAKANGVMKDAEELGEAEAQSEKNTSNEIVKNYGDPDPDPDPLIPLPGNSDYRVRIKDGTEIIVGLTVALGSSIEIEVVDENNAIQTINSIASGINADYLTYVISGDKRSASFTGVTEGQAVFYVHIEGYEQGLYLPINVVDKSPRLWVGGIALDGSKDYPSVSGEGIVGSVSYKSTGKNSGTLILDNATITGVNELDNLYQHTTNIYARYLDLTIELKGENTLGSTNGVDYSVVTDVGREFGPIRPSSVSGVLTITGGGNLLVQGGIGSVLSGGGIQIRGTKVYAIGAVMSGDLTVTKSDVKISEDKESYGEGTVWIMGNTSIIDSIFSIEGPFIGMFSPAVASVDGRTSGNIEIRDSKTYFAGAVCGIYCGSLSISNTGSGRYTTRVEAKSFSEDPAPEGHLPYAGIIATEIKYDNNLKIVKPVNGVVKEIPSEVDLPARYLCTVYDGSTIADHVIIEPAPSSVPLMATVKAKGKKAVNVSWNAMAEADGYDVFFARCNTKKKKYTCTYAGSVNGSNSTSWTKNDLKKRTPYKVYVMAYTLRGGEKTYIAKSPTVHAYTGGYSSKYTNPKSVKVKKTKVSVKKGKTYKIRASVRKLKKGRRLINSAHAPKLRYLSSNTSVATVTKYGKIKGKSAGTCKVYVYAVNGVKKVVNVTVK